MTIPYSTGKSLSIDQLTNVNITDVSNNDVLQYNSTTGEWDNVVLGNPYYLNLGYNKYNTGDVRTITSGATYYPMGDFTFNSTEYPTQYNTSDFTGGYWKPSQTGIYLFVAKTQVRSLNDRMDILDFILRRKTSGGSEADFARVGVRTENTGTADDLYYYSPILTIIIKIDTIGDEFRIAVFSRTDGASDLRLYEDFRYTSVEITKLG